MTRKDQHNTFNTWMTEHAGILHKVARSFCDHSSDQDDLLQEIHLAVWHAVPGFARNSKASSYVYRVALNRAISWVRRERSVRRKHEELAAASAHLTPPDTDPRLEIIYTEIRRLTKTERALILLQLDGFSYDEIATTLGLTATNVGARLTRLRQKLSANLKDQ